MEKVFKDKTRTEDTLHTAAATVKEIAGMNTLPKWIDGLCDDCNRLSAKSAIAHNSAMHYTIANDAAYLGERISGIRYVALAIKWMTGDDISHGKRAEMLQLFADRMEGILERLRPVHSSKDVAWELVVEHRREAEQFFSYVSDMVNEHWRQQRGEMNSWLEEDVDQSKPLPVKYHDAFVQRLLSHDYFHDYSDDIKVWRRGNEDRKFIMDVTKRHPHYLKLWEICSTTADGRHGNAKELYKLRRIECQQ